MNASAASSKIIIVTGKPATGKTTLVKQLTDLMRPKLPVLGFLTEEIRAPHHGPRIGFDIVLVSNDDTDAPIAIPKRATLARVDTYAEHFPPSPPRVGQYLVNVPSFESIALPCLKRAMDFKSSNKTILFVIDEIGKMELHSPEFIRQLQALVDLVLSNPSPEGPILLTTKGLAVRMFDHLASRADVINVEITHNNRDAIKTRLKDLLTSRFPT